MGDNYYVLTPISYYFFANTILKCAAFPFLTSARKPTVNFYSGKNSFVESDLPLEFFPVPTL